MIDRTLIEKLYRERYQDLVAFALYRLKNKDRAEEVVQEVFMKALLPLAKGPVNPKALYTFLRGHLRTEIWNANKKDAREVPLKLAV